MSDSKAPSDKPLTTYVVTPPHHIITFNHPRLSSFDPFSTRICIRRSDSYCRAITVIDKQLTIKDVTSEVLLPVYFKYFVDAQFLKSTIESSFIANIPSYKALTGEQLWKHLDTESIDSMISVNLSPLDNIAAGDVRMNIWEPEFSLKHAAICPLSCAPQYSLSDLDFKWQCEAGPIWCILGQKQRSRSRKESRQTWLSHTMSSRWISRNLSSMLWSNRSLSNQSTKRFENLKLFDPW